jgi:EAL domain-containing protein (putative c-di-GMP-specific phosphodiesterase class I)
MHPVRLASVFQPIVTFADPRYPRAMEALSRFPDGCRPDEIFASARAAGTGDGLELSAVSAHLDAAVALPLDIALAVNLSTNVVTRHADALAVHLRRTSRLVIVELTEESDRDDLGALAELRSAGIAIALDDAGAGFTGAARIERVTPDIVKLDGALLRAARGSSGAHDLLRALVASAQAVGAELVAEGIETVADAACAISLGASMGQGYAFGAPAPADHYRLLHRESA